MYTVYILKTSKNTLYTGICKDLKKRLNEHRTHGKKSSKYMRSFDSFNLAYTEEVKTRSIALKREAEIKKLTKGQKEILINNV